MKEPLAIYHPGYLATVLGKETVNRLMIQFEEEVLGEYGSYQDGSVFFLEYRAIHFDWLAWPPPFTLLDEENLILVMGASWRNNHLHLDHVAFYPRHSRTPRAVQQAMTTYKNLFALDCRSEAHHQA